MSGVTRRTLLGAAVVYGGLSIGAAWPRATRAAVGSIEPVALSAAEWRTVEAITARIVPSDDGTPGAREAGSVNFIDRLSSPR